MAGATELGEDAIEWLEERELVLQDHDPEGDADMALGHELVGRRRREECGRARTLTAPTIAFAVIASAIAADVDFEDVTVGGGGDFLEGELTIGTAFLVVGQIAVFIGGRQMIVVASAMALAAALLAA